MEEEIQTMVMKKKYMFSIGAVLAGFLLLMCICGGAKLTAAAAEVEVSDESTIPEGVYINETPVGGMTIGEAREQLMEKENQIRQAVFTLIHGEEVLTIPFEEVGLTFQNTTDILYEAATVGQSGMLIERYKELRDLENDKLVCTWSFTYDQQMLEDKVAAYVGAIEKIEPVDATISKEGFVFTVTPEVMGREVDAETTMENVRTAIAQWNGQSVSAEVAEIVIEPHYTEEALSTIGDVIADFYTVMGGEIATGRGKNVVRGAELIDGTILLPGESFSAHAALSPFTKENGYDYATAFNEGGYVDDLGGGVCSLTSTLYNAIMYAELQVDRRYNHSMVVNYARPGLDSTVNDNGSKDLVFTNNFEHPIYIEARVWKESDEVAYCYFGIWGTKTEEMAERDVTLYYEVVEREDAVYNYIVDPELEPGEEVVEQSAYPKLVVNAYKKVEVNGEVVSDELLHTDYYRRSDGTIRHNPIEESTDESGSGETDENGTSDALPDESGSEEPSDESTESGSGESTGADDVVEGAANSADAEESSPAPENE